MESEKRRKPKRKPNPLASKSNICWDCAKANCGCKWSRSGKPIEGWKATPYTINEGTQYATGSFYIEECPEFERDSFFFGLVRAKDMDDIPSVDIAAVTPGKTYYTVVCPYCGFVHKHASHSKFFDKPFALEMSDCKSMILLDENGVPVKNKPYKVIFYEVNEHGEKVFKLPTLSD